MIIITTIPSTHHKWCVPLVSWSAARRNDDDDDDDVKPVGPTWAMGAFFRDMRRIHINHLCIEEGPTSGEHQLYNRRRLTHDGLIHVSIVHCSIASLDLPGRIECREGCRVASLRPRSTPGTKI